MLTGDRLHVDRWDLADGSRIVWDVRGRSVASVQAFVHSLSPNAWSQTINVGWTDRVSGEGATNIGTLTSASPSLRPIDCSTIDFIVIELATPQSTQTLLELRGVAKSD